MRARPAEGREGSGLSAAKSTHPSRSNPPEQAPKSGKGCGTRKFFNRALREIGCDIIRAWRPVGLGKLRKAGGSATRKLISRSWLLDPVSTQVSAAAVPQDSKEPWNGEFYANLGHGKSRSWEEAVKYGFISAGGGAWFSNTLKLLSAGDRVWVKAPGYGFVGVARVTGPAQPASSFQIDAPQGKMPALEVLKGGHYHREFVNDPDRCEYFVPVRWLQTVPLEEGVNEIGLFGQQNTVCKPTSPKWRSTVERLKQHFPHFADADEPAARSAMK